MTIRKIGTKLVTSIITATLAITAAPAVMPEIARISVVEAAETSIITGGNGTVTTSLTTGETATVNLNDCVMTVKVGTSTTKFANGSKVIGMAKIAADDLLHIFTLSGKYYCMDLRYGSFNTIEAYRNTATGKYTAARLSGSYEVFGSSMIPNSLYFYERLSVNSTSRELLISRADYDGIVNPVAPVTYYTVRFQDWNGSILSEQSVASGTAATPPANPTRSGYTFIGWDNDITNVTSNLIVTAQYSQNTVYYNVTFKDYDGTVLKSESVEAGHNAMPPANPIRQGYTFRGWDKAYTNILADTVVTAVYTVTPDGSSSSSTDSTTDTEVKFDINFWWNQYTTGKITWDQLMQALAQYQWTSQSVTDNASHTTTYYFYDSNGVLQRTESVTTGQSTTNNSGQGTATVTGGSQGTANVDVQSTGQGGATGTAEAHSESHSVTQSTGGGNTTVVVEQGKITYNEYHTKKAVTLTMTQNGKTTQVVKVSFNKKKGVMKWNDHTYKNVKDVSFTATSRQILMLQKDGTAYVIARAKGKDGNIYTPRKLKGKWNSIKRNNARLAIRLAAKSGKTKGVKNLQPKVKADKSALAN